jgi:hypothetical protein
LITTLTGTLPLKPVVSQSICTGVSAPPAGRFGTKVLPKYQSPQPAAVAKNAAVTGPLSAAPALRSVVDTRSVSPSVGPADAPVAPAAARLAAPAAATVSVPAARSACAAVVAV